MSLQDVRDKFDVIMRKGKRFRELKEGVALEIASRITLSPADTWSLVCDLLESIIAAHRVVAGTGAVVGVNEIRIEIAKQWSRYLR